MVYIVKDHHCYPITDEKLKLVASKTNQGGCDNLLKYMADIKWTRRHENITKIKNVDELVNLRKENNIVILPEDMRMNTPIDTYVNTSGYYVEYIHWNNNGILDGFIDHRKYMYLLNDEYETRKVMCDKLFDRYILLQNARFQMVKSVVYKYGCINFQANKWIHYRIIVQ